jgi:hypothetical protein
MNRRSWRRDRTEQGAVALLVGILSLVLLGFTAFVTDFGTAYANQRNLQNGADAAALAVGRSIAYGAAPTANCATVAATFSSTGRTTADQYFGKNVATNSGAALETGTAGFSVDCQPINGVNQVVVHVVGSQLSPTFAGKVFGWNDLQITKEARVIVGPAGTVVGLRPFAICQVDATNLAGNNGLPYTLDFDNASAGCGYAPGNWGTLDFDGGSNSTGDLANWIANGYNGAISNASPFHVMGDPGAPGPGGLEAAMNTMMNSGDIVIPVFSALTLNGQNSDFTITGFVSVQVCGWKLNNKSGNGACFTAPSTPVPANYLQVKFGHAIPIGGLNLQCQMADPSGCDMGARVYSLAD